MGKVCSQYDKYSGQGLLCCLFYKTKQYELQRTEDTLKITLRNSWTNSKIVVSGWRLSRY